MERESAEKVIFEMETQKNSQFVAASLGRGLHKLLIVVGSDGLERGIGVRLAQIPTDSYIVSDTQSAINMCPSQIWKPRFPNVKIWEKSIELPEGTLQRYNFFLKPPNFMAFFRLQSQKFPFFMLFWVFLLSVVD